MAADEVVRRAERAKERAEIKRHSYANKIGFIHIVEVRSIDDNELVSQLFVLVDRLDEFWSAFNVEDDAWLDQLIELGTSNAYSDKLKLELLEKIAFIKSTVKRFRCYGLPYSWNHV
jgi:hypothetical protein